MCAIGHQENKCSLTTSISETARQLMGKPAPNAGADYTATPPSPLATEMERCFGYATEILAVSEEARAILKEERFLTQGLYPRGEPQGAGLREKQVQSRNKLRMICLLATELQKSLPVVEALVGTTIQTGSSCPYETRKGRSLG